MSIIINQAIYSHLVENKDFLEALTNEFDEKQITEIINYANDINNERPEIMERFYDWFTVELDDADTTILCIGWDSDNWGPGGNGFIMFKSVFGIVKMESSDYSDDRIEIFSKKEFFPWCIENLMNDYITIDSDVYTEEELLDLANEMGTLENTELKINGKVI